MIASSRIRGRQESMGDQVAMAGWKELMGLVNCSKRVRMEPVLGKRSKKMSW